jgi:ankyrin repeat protein
MPINLTQDNIEILQGRYSSLLNYKDDDVFAPIDPATYVDTNGDSLLHIAVLANDLDSVSILVSAGFDVNYSGDLNNTPLHYAYKINSPEIIAVLEKAGARNDIFNLFGKIPSDVTPRKQR